tara:strand:- start:1925 stop:2854 length:930 start_codon:yes stop_codon:yes gene_type:complete
MADLTGVSKNMLIFDKSIHRNATNVEAIVFSKKAFTDEFGFRVPNKNFQYNKNNSSALILGDSVSFGVGVEENKTFVGLLRNDFKNINFFNSSVSGYHLEHYPEILKNNINLNNLNDIILFFTLNDISFEQTVVNADKKEKKNKNKESINFFNSLRSNFFFTKLNSFLRNKSVFYMWIKGISTKPSERHFYYTYPIYKNDSSVESLNKEIRKLKKIIKNNSLNFLVVILPYEFQTRKENCNDQFLLPQKKINEILLNENIKYMDYTNFFCNYEKPNSLFLKYDPVHLSAKGHTFVFKLLQKDLNYLVNY